MAVHTASYPIHTYEADANGNATFAAIFRFLQDAAATHAMNAGYGLGDLMENASLWVLSRFLYRCGRTPKWPETLLVETWPTGTEGVFALRDWLVSDEERKTVATATSGWVVIDVEKRTPVRVERVVKRMDVVVDRHLFERNAAKVPLLEGEAPLYRTRATFTDMDLNHHVNATRYVEWMLEGLPDGFRESGNELSEIEINFNGECRSGDELVVLARESGTAGEFLHSVAKVGDGTVVCRARSVWKPPVT